MSQVYFPSDEKKRLREACLANASKYVLGYRMGNICVVVCIANGPDTTSTELETVGLVQNTSPTTSSEGFLAFSFNYEQNLPLVQGVPTIILFDPPNFRNLEYFSVNPILLQSMGPDKPSVTETLVQKFVKSEFAENIEPLEEYSISDDAVIDRINSVVKVRRSRRQLINTFSGFKEQRSGILACIYLVFLKTLLFFTSILNYKIHGASLVSLSNTFRQLDLRIRQIGYFPVQFLFYYDKAFLRENSEFVKKLDLPIFNQNLNFRNSNYINLYNSLWLIFNDVLLGVTIYNIALERESVLKRAVPSLIEYLHSELQSLIVWVSKNHPAGFKLNDELGSFMGDLYLWSLNYWNNTTEKIHIQHTASFCFFFRILCYSGMTFLLALVNDTLKVLTAHVSAFYFVAAKIYAKQTQVLKSLFQLFRGKKYNVLRNRIDNLNNYDIEMAGNMAHSDNSGFEIDQLLLGTLLFMIVIFLLPTVFAFYFTFFILRLGILIVSNLLENLQIILNFTPLFVVLLKLKNSRRLQGGIMVRFLGIYRNVNYMKLLNKSLTHGAIFINFFKLFSNSKTFKSHIVKSFINGDAIKMEYKHELKFYYLMLPGNYNVLQYIFDKKKTD